MAACSKKGCQNVFTTTIGRIEDEKRRGNKIGIYSTVLNDAATAHAEHVGDSNETEAPAGIIHSVVFTFYTYVDRSYVLVYN